MDVVLAVCRNVIVDNYVDVRDVETARCDVGRDEDFTAAGFELGERAETRRLAECTV